MTQKRGLGRGLGALIRDDSPIPAEQAVHEGIREIEIDSIHKGAWQPRQTFAEEALAELTESVRRRGILQPLLVREVDGGFELIAGERRMRAAQAAGLSAVPVIVMDAADHDALELALMENLQREDLNVMEEAAGYQLLAERFTVTQEQIAERVGKARASVTNTMRLLSLPPEVQGMLRSGELSAGHAKVLLGLEITEEQILFARRVTDEGLSVRNLEKAVRRVKRHPRTPRRAVSDMPKDHLSYLSDRLHSHFGTSVRVAPSRTFANGKKGKGTIEIDFYSNEELDRLLDLLGLTEEQ